MGEHKDECECAVCRDGLEKTKLWEAAQIEKYGWFAHFVIDEGIHNIHTHGIQESFGQPDLQCTLPLPRERANVILRLFHNIVDYIKEGVELKDGLYLDKIINDYKVNLVAAWEGHRPVLRLILPDPQGRLEPDEMTAEYACQYDNLFETDEEE